MKLAVQIEGQKRNNIGDVFQALAVADHLPKLNLILDREKLPDAVSEGAVLLIANGWYMHDYSAFPPPANVVPVYASIHFSNAEILQSEVNRAHFKQHGPIGARDMKTLVMLRAAGIQAYYSGCFTVGLKRREPNAELKDLLVVDGVDHPLSEQEVGQIGDALGRTPERLSNDPKESGPEFAEYSKDAVLQAEALLSSYCSARHVVTTKIHCALPCLAMGVPVTLVHPHPDEERLAPAREFLKIVDTRNLHTLTGYGERLIDEVKLAKRQQWIRTFIKKSVLCEGNPIARLPEYRREKRGAVCGSALWRIGLRGLYELGFARQRLGKIYR